ncbi:MAG: DUF192 domain-containing protein [Deltaproteobacteria bacterium]|nr:DUF192 domain-containing protein [Deltaproteobacteria bacterium]
MIRRPDRLRALVVLPMLLVALAACSSSRGPSEPSAEPRPERPASSGAAKVRRPEPSDGPVVVLEPPNRPPVRVDVEVAKTPAARQRGLMFRRALPERAGMLFLFERPEHHVFWMRNTYIPLDMIFIREDMTVLGVVENATPRTDDSREVPGISLHVLEVNGGLTRRWGVGTGTRVRFERIEPLPRAADDGAEAELPDDEPSETEETP